MGQAEGKNQPKLTCGTKEAPELAASSVKKWRNFRRYEPGTGRGIFWVYAWQHLGMLRCRFNTPLTRKDVWFSRVLPVLSLKKNCWISAPVFLAILDSLDSSSSSSTLIAARAPASTIPT